MVGAEFASCLLKLGRAEEHLDLLKSEFAEWGRSDPYAVSTKQNVDGSRHAVVVNIPRKPPFDRWSLIAGDCIHNLRSALDNVLYAVAIRESGATPPPNFDKLQFPLTSSIGEFNSQCARRLKGISAKTLRWVEEAQPYNRFHPSNRPCSGFSMNSTIPTSTGHSISPCLISLMGR